ncbi:MAG: methionyl-tRNA formyltransferase [Treponema sp.]|nr:methionyl-tRNA formyltransferase [Treponema sp.]
MRLIFAGNPELAVPSLRAVSSSVVAVLTNPDKSSGRHRSLEAMAVAAAAQQWLPPHAILKVEHLKAQERALIAAFKADLLVSFAFGHIFGPKFLALFPYGGINIHPSLLPLYRGPTPIQQTILNRDSIAGITIQKIALEVDAGDILYQQTIPLSGRETTACLSETVAQSAAAVLPSVIQGIESASLNGTVQDSHAVSYCTLLKKEDGLINWTDDALTIDARIRAFNPWPLSWTLHKGQRLFIIEAYPLASHTTEQAGTVVGIDKKLGILIQTGAGLLAVTRLHYQYKKPLDWQDFLNGSRNVIGTVLE